MKIKDIPENERPVERLVQKGEAHLSNIELLSILLKSGSKDLSVYELSTKILRDYPDFNGITLGRLQKYKGIGIKKAATVIAAFELFRRINKEVKNIYNQKFNSSKLVFDYYKDTLGDLNQEHFYVIYLDNKKKIIGEKLLFKGTINKSLVHPREIFKEAYLLSASSIICVHNHPSGNSDPSKEDVFVTKSLLETGNLLGINLVDHIIICKTNYYSFFDSGNVL